nr:hypothetical protein HK105_004405 [Polyrhizophydium stewartii]
MTTAVPVQTSASVRASSPGLLARPMLRFADDSTLSPASSTETLAGAQSRRPSSATVLVSVLRRPSTPAVHTAAPAVLSSSAAFAAAGGCPPAAAAQPSPAISIDSFASGSPVDLMPDTPAASPEAGPFLALAMPPHVDNPRSSMASDPAARPTVTPPPATTPPPQAEPFGRRSPSRASADIYSARAPSKELSRSQTLIVNKPQLAVSNKVSYNFHEVVRVTGSVVPRVALPALLLSAWAAFWTTVFIRFDWQVGVQSLLITILSVVISLLLVFRTNTAYDR